MNVEQSGNRQLQDTVPEVNWILHGGTVENDNRQSEQRILLKDLNPKPPS
jgi:hypothetical protein